MRVLDSRTENQEQTTTVNQELAAHTYEHTFARHQ